MSRLIGKVALITGSSSGIGRAIALRYAQEGARVLVHGTREEKAAAVVAEIRAAGGAAEFLLADVGQPDACASLVARAIERFGALDVLVNNAGQVTLEPFLDFPAASWQRFLDVHVSGAFFCSQAAARHMVERGHGGRILMTASVAGFNGMFGFAGYGTVKGALIALMKVLAVELAPHAITVNTIAPGPVRNDMMLALWGEERLKDREHTIPLGRMATAEEVAHIAAFLASEEAKYMTGQTLVLDGGATAAGCYTHEVWKRAQY
jgi:glucose 1-dehydrogenase